jgi:hypothetical protein
MINILTRRIKTTIVMLLFATLCFGQSYTIEGLVRDNNSQTPVHNASVKIKGTTKGTFTDSTGHFILQGLSTETALLQITCVGSLPVEKKAKAGEINTIYLEKDVLALNEVEIAGYKKENPLKNPTEEPQSLQTAIQTIGTTQIQQTGAVNIIEALKYTVSGNFSEQGRKRKNFISLRGQNAEYAIDGISFYQFMDAPNALSANVVDEVEITRSSNTLLMGYSGLNGVANFKTKTFDTFTTICGHMVLKWYGTAKNTSGY